MIYSILHIKKYFVFILFFSLTAIKAFSQDTYKPAVESFETEKAVSFYNASNGKLSLSETHRRFGKSSLQWVWKGESSIGTSHFKILSRKESPLKYGEHFAASPTLQMSIYNEKANNGKITISFEKDGVKKVWFDIELSFTGWRRIWVPFYDMQGDIPKKGAQVDYDYFKISTSIASGKLFFDDITFSQFQDNRYPYPDEIVPFIKAGVNLGDDHWMPLISNYDRIKNFKAKPVSANDLEDLKKIEQFITKDLASDKQKKLSMSGLREMYQSLKIKDNGNTIIGPPLIFIEEVDYFDENQQGPRVFNDLRKFGEILKKIANSYGLADPSEKKEIETMFLASTRYFLDQGFQAGSNGGTRHHIGYSTRAMTEAFFTMRQLLADNGLLTEIGKSLHWLFNLGLVLDDEKNFHVNIDYLNTQAYYHLMLIFLFNKTDMQADILRAYSKYLSIILAQQSEDWGFKVDSTAWHHGGHYPAYALGAFSEVPKLIRMLSGTGYRLSPEGHKNFENAFLAARTYSQLYDWGFGNAGRHPLSGGSILSLKQPFLDMAYSGNSEGTFKIDTVVAAAYLRLWGNEDAHNTSVFTKVNGIQKEDLSGYYPFPFAATAVHRRDDWAAIIKGYSKYVWASEIYVDANRYGRYPANGTVQLLNSKGEIGSGFRQEGWDWNRYPGATIIDLPLKELEAKMPLIMFRSNETFAGSTTLNGNGIFGMILNESKGSNADGPATKVGYEGKLYAKKSVFSYGDKLICIGTDISSIDEINPTQTNIFQLYLTDTKAPIYTSSKTIDKFPYKMELKEDPNQGSWLIDPYGNGYHILSNNTVQIKKEKQHSYNNAYSVNSGSGGIKAKGKEETEGDYATAWIDYGKAPKNAFYQYVIYPFLNQENQKDFGDKIKNDKSFTIARADSIAHIVIDNETNTTGYVVFEANRNLGNGVLKEVSAPALVMVNYKSAAELVISAVQPDLNFPENEKGKLKSFSNPVELKLTLTGKWVAVTEDFMTKTISSGDKTIITLQCINGLPENFTLKKM